MVIGSNNGSDDIYAEHDCFVREELHAGSQNETLVIGVEKRLFEDCSGVYYLWGATCICVLDAYTDSFFPFCRSISSITLVGNLHPELSDR
jgi:hypothetical protein